MDELVTLILWYLAPVRDLSCNALMICKENLSSLTTLPEVDFIVYLDM